MKIEHVALNIADPIAWRSRILPPNPPRVSIPKPEASLLAGVLIGEQPATTTNSRNRETVNMGKRASSDEKRAYVLYSLATNDTGLNRFTQAAFSRP